MVTVYCLVAMTAFCGFCLFAADWGRVQLAKTELQTNADAAARYAVTGLSDGSHLAKANYLAALNSVDGGYITYVSADVVTGTWDTSSATFTATNKSPTAVKVTARRTAANGNPIKLSFGPMIGVKQADVTVSAIARQLITGYGIVGLNYITMSGNASDSYWSNNGSAGKGKYGSIASNGDITLSGSASIQGDAHPGIGRTVYGASAVSGSTTPLTTTLSYANGDAGSYVYSNDNSNVPSGYTPGSSLKIGSSKSLTLPGGNYYFNNIDIAGSLTFTGPATIYCYGYFSMSGSADTASSIPGNLKLVMCPDTWGNPPSSVTITSSSALYANIYAPQSNISLSGSGDIYGSVVGLSVTMSGTSAIHYDLSLDPQNGTISLVK